MEAIRGQIICPSCFVSRVATVVQGWGELVYQSQNSDSVFWDPWLALCLCVELTSGLILPDC